jgi:hypothetical protein
MFQFKLDGQNLGSPQDLYAPKIGAGDPVDFGTVTFPTNVMPKLEVDITGKNAASSGHEFGLDYLKLTPEP